MDVGICGDVKLAAKEMTEALRAGGPIASDENKTERIIKFTEV